MPYDSPAQIVTAEGATFELWGSDCYGCEGNTTFGSQYCDNCGSAEKTFPLYAPAGSLEL